MPCHKPAGFCIDHDQLCPGSVFSESKSLKLYLFSFRDHGDFHENCINTIMKDLQTLLSPRFIEVWGEFTPRGGISIHPYANYGKPGTKWALAAAKKLEERT